MFRAQSRHIDFLVRDCYAYHLLCLLALGALPSPPLFALGVTVTQEAVTGDVPSDAPKKPVRTKANYIPPNVWAEVAALYETGAVTQQQIAEQLGVHFAYVSRKFKKLGVGRPDELKGVQQEAVKEQVAKVQEAALERAEELGSRAGRTVEFYIDANEKISRLALMTLARAQKEQRPLATATNDLKAIKLTMDILATGRTEAYTLLGLDKDDDKDDNLPDLVIREMTEDEMDAVRNSKREEDVGVSLLEGGDVPNLIADEGMDDDIAIEGGE